MSRKTIYILLVLGIVYGQGYVSNVGILKNDGGNEEKTSGLGGVFSFAKNPIILKKGDDKLLINTGEKIKVITSNGIVVTGMYYKISTLNKEIIVSAKKKNKIYYENIIEISMGLGHKSAEYGTTGAILGCLGGFILGSIIVRNDAYRGVMGAMGGLAGGIVGLTQGLAIGFATPIDFEEPITVSENDWQIINE